MENTEERLDATAMATPPMQDATAVQAAGDTRPEVTTNATDDVGGGGGNDFAAMFARWVDNPLVAIALKNPRLCRFIVDLLAGDDADCAAHRNFPQAPPQMPADAAARFCLDKWPRMGAP